MIVTLNPSSIRGSIRAPRSKSSMQRACAAALLSEGETLIKNPGVSNDDKAALDVIQQLGASVKFHRDHLLISSKGLKPVSNLVNVGESGLGVRMFAPIVALSALEITISGKGSLVNRPMNFFDQVFPKLGIEIKSNNGRLPLIIKGPLKPGNIEVDGSLSSQFITGLLMAYPAAGASDVTIKVIDLHSKPYIDLTLDVMKHFGINVVNNNYQVFYFPKVKTRYQPKTFNVEGDWSGSAFLLVAGAIAGNITVEDLNIASSQADKKILEALKDCKATLDINETKIGVGSGSLKAFEFDATDCPDLFPPLVALASYCHGITRLKGITRLTHKESNRALTLQQEFGKLGIDIILKDDELFVNGGRVRGGTVSSHHDHRIAMACAVAGLKADGPVRIGGADAVKKSYPDFFDDIGKLGGAVEIEQSSINS